MKNKVALITGGAKGIGRQVSISLAKEGYDIAVNYHSTESLAKEVCEIANGYGVRAISVYADVGNINDLEKMYDEVYDKLGRLDLVVNNAGVSNEVYFLDATEKDFDSLMQVDWKGLFFSSQIAAKRMIEQSVEGVIINVTSNQVEGCWPRATIYASAKAAVSKFTKNAAMELSQKGIRMVAIAPGYTDVGWEKGDIRLQAAERLPLKRFATTEEIAEGVIYLASDNAKYIIGTTLTIDGGATLPVVAANDFVD